MFPVEKVTVVDGMRQRMYVAEEREVSVLGWETYESLKNVFNTATKQGKVTQDRSELLLDLYKPVCLGLTEKADS